MREHPDHHDAELLLRLYELRQGEKLRQAFDWVLREFRAESLEDFNRRYPLGAPESGFLRMVMTYWDMAASIVNHSLIQEDFFFENTNEFWTLWQKVKHLVPATREAYNNPQIWTNLETLVGKYEKWLAHRAPDALTALRRLAAEGPKK